MIAHAMDPERREQIERAMADPERCMPSERAALEAQGFVAKTERIEPGEGVGGVSGSAARPANLPVFPEGTLPVNEENQIPPADHKDREGTVRIEPGEGRTGVSGASGVPNDV